MKHFRKTISVLIAIIMAFGSFLALPFTASATEIDRKTETGSEKYIAAASATMDEVTGYEYELLDDGTAKLTNYKGNDKVLDIPSQINGYYVTVIGDWCFVDNKTLESIVIPDSVKGIGHYAFAGCANISSITISSSITSIGEYVFKDCTSLTDINVDDNNAFYSSYDGVLFDKEYKTLVCYPRGKNDSSYEIPDGVTSIGQCAFEICTNLTSITMPDSVISINYRAFYYCTNLKSIKMSDSITLIDNSAFFSCTSLTDLTIPDTVTSIGLAAFCNCENLTSLTIPESVTSIAVGAFYNCSNLLSAQIFSTSSEIGRYAFGYVEYFDEETGFKNNKAIDGFTINGIKSSTAEQYANDNGFEFAELTAEIIGDVNGDGVISIVDATIIQKFGVGLYTPEDANTFSKCADVNGDGRISILDVTCIQKYLTGGYKNTGLLGK